MTGVGGLILWLLSGVSAGIITGLLPSLHPNTVLFISLPLYLSSEVPAPSFLSFAVGLSVTHTFLDFIPSILLGAPDAGTALSILPGHRYMLQGKAYKAIKLTVFGGVFASLIALLLLPFLFFVLPALYRFISPYLHLILVLILGYLIYGESGSRKKAYSLLILLVSGFLGLGVFASPLANQNYILFSVFSGLFGVPTLLLSARSGREIPKQDMCLSVDLVSSFKASWYGFLSGLLSGMLPGLGSSQSAFLVKRVKQFPLKQFITALGGINTTNILFSVLALYLIGKPRSGAALIINDILSKFTFQHVLLVLGLSIFALSLAAPLTLILGAKAIALVEKFDYRKLAYLVLFVIFVGTFLLNGLFGLLVLITSAAIGFSSLFLGTRRGYCMGVLLIPTILYYAGYSLPLL